MQRGLRPTLTNHRGETPLHLVMVALFMLELVLVLVMEAAGSVVTLVPRLPGLMERWAPSTYGSS